MQTSAFVLLSAVALSCSMVASPVSAAPPCDLGAIQGKLLPNGTAGLTRCAETTGYDIWTASEFPTKEQSKEIKKTRDCADYLNQINQRANSEIQCDLTIAGTTTPLGEFLVDLLTGTDFTAPTGSMAGSDDSETGSQFEEDETTDKSEGEDVESPILGSLSDTDTTGGSLPSSPTSSSLEGTPEPTDSAMGLAAGSLLSTVTVIGAAFMLVQD